MKRFSPDWVLAQAVRLNGFKSRHIELSTGIVHYFIREPKNAKGTIVLLHGVGASSGHYWQVAGPLFRSGYTVVVPDLPCHGQSPDPSCVVDSQTFFQVFVEWTQKVLPEQFILVGNSLGGAISLRYAVEYPYRLKKVMLISPAGGFTDEQDWKLFKSSLEFKSIEDSKKFVPKIYHRTPFYLPFIYQPFFEAMCRTGLRQLIENTHFQDFQRIVSNKDRLPPILIVWGKSEKLFSEKHLRWFRENLPKQVQFEEPENIGHCPQLDSPKWLWKRILRFSEET